MPIFLGGLDQNPSGNLKIMRPHNMSWPSLKHAVEDESRHGNVQEPVFFIKPTGSRKMREGGGEGFSFPFLSSLNL